MSTPEDQVQTQQAPSVRVPKRLPLVVRPGFRSTTFGLTDPTVRSPVSDAALFNCYAELDPEDNQYWVEKRLGTKTLLVQAGGAGGIGIAFSTNAGLPFAIFGANIYAYNGVTLTNLPYTGSGHPLVTGRMATFVSLPPTTNVTALTWAANGEMWNAAYNTTTGSGSYNAYRDFVTGAGVPWAANSLCDGCVYLDGVLYVMDQSGNIWGSDGTGSPVPTVWPATTLIKAGGRNDTPVCLAQQLEYIIALKTTSLRCFYDAGSAAQTLGVGSNLAWVEGADANFGCASAGTVQLIDQTLVWVTNNDKGTLQVARMDGLQVQIISTPSIERLLQNVNVTVFSQAPNAPASILYSNGIKRGGHRMYSVTVPPAATLNGVGYTLVYDLDQQLWYIWYSNGFSYWTIGGIASGVGSGAGKQGVFAQDLTSGALYLTDIDQVYPTDSGFPCQVDIYTPSADLNTRRRKQLNALYFVNDQVSGSAMYVRKSDNDFRTWSPFRKVSLSVDQPTLTRCGSFRQRSLNIRHNASTPFRIKAADSQIDLGTL